VGSVHTANASASYAVAASGGTLSETIATDKSSYLRGETVRMSALVKRDGMAVSGASVTFRVTLPSGTVASLSATTGSDGYARASYRIAKAKAAVGSYALRALASSGGASVSSSSTFLVN
jgi:uncharacterized protein YfaS (alpha-2-macroglobulin family)